jgi:FixJ family two-component response regulator
MPGMSGMSGPELQHELTVRGHATKIICTTVRGDEVLRRQLIRERRSRLFVQAFQ